MQLPQEWGPAAAVPLSSEDASGRGVLFLARGPSDPVFTDAELEPLLAFAGQAALALELADRRRDAEQIALLEERDRIARDLHDLAIQRLFATGMTLQSAARLVDRADASQRLSRAVDDLDETIKIIRSTIFGLRTRDREGGAGLRARAAQAVGDAATLLGHPPRLSMEGLLDTDVPAHIADHVVAALNELLSNAARHSGATRVAVTLETLGGDVVLSVADNGVGVPEQGRRSGLTNLDERARSVGGDFRLERLSEGGSRLVWQAPIPSSGPALDGTF